jgi:hypothetical protein
VLVGFSATEIVASATFDVEEQFLLEESVGSRDVREILHSEVRNTKFARNLIKRISQNYAGLSPRIPWMVMKTQIFVLEQKLCHVFVYLN